ncbi:hypothetical protein [Streptococcus oralis]|jgi:hypothetical protein|uniref:hypothetical protein n=1 Tax=Streptococcus oralis TaxID=1303 RepID=UPI00039E15A3|nr:hypothetical protein [Streptococcus oralis]CAK1608305.1 hypothetical protein SDENT7746_02760 [Streptococcus oralis subsp. dentisani]
MGITEEKINWIAEQSYWVEKKRNDVMYHPTEGEEYYYNPDNVELGKFKVIFNPIDNTSNGMQAMAVAPVDKNGNVDYSHVAIAYAGTNKDDIKDIETDLQSLGLGRDKLQLRSSLNSAKVVVPQFVTALNYANVN